MYNTAIDREFELHFKPIWEVKQFEVVLLTLRDKTDKEGTGKWGQWVLDDLMCEMSSKTSQDNYMSSPGKKFFVFHSGLQQQSICWALASLSGDWKTFQNVNFLLKNKIMNTGELPHADL